MLSQKIKSWQTKDTDYVVEIRQAVALCKILLLNCMGQTARQIWETRKTMIIYTEVRLTFHPLSMTILSFLSTGSASLSYLSERSLNTSLARCGQPAGGEGPAVSSRGRDVNCTTRSTLVICEITSVACFTPYCTMFTRIRPWLMARPTFPDCVVPV